MTSSSTRSNRFAVVLIVYSAITSYGCTSPPSVISLLTKVQGALRTEASHLVSDVERDQEHFDQTRRGLDRAFDQDLKARSDITPGWVGDAVNVYVIAREEVIRHEERVIGERQQRIANLMTAATAQERAIGLLEK